MEPLYVAHYKQKRPSVSDDMLAVLEAGARNKWSILKEVSDAISAGIHISHGRPAKMKFKWCAPLSKWTSRA